MSEHGEGRVHTAGNGVRQEWISLNRHAASPSYHARHDASAEEKIRTPRAALPSSPPCAEDRSRESFDDESARLNLSRPERTDDNEPRDSSDAAGKGTKLSKRCDRVTFAARQVRRRPRPLHGRRGYRSDSFRTQQHPRARRSGVLVYRPDDTRTRTEQRAESKRRAAGARPRRDPKGAAPAAAAARSHPHRTTFPGTIPASETTAAPNRGISIPPFPPSHATRTPRQTRPTAAGRDSRTRRRRSHDARALYKTPTGIGPS